MKKTIIAVALIAMTASLIGCTKRSDQSAKQSAVADSTRTAPSQALQLAWLKGAFISASSEALPPFPLTLSGYRSKDSKDFWNKPFPSRGAIRVFSGNPFQGIADFPNTMNGCSSGVFMIRWRSADPNMLIESSVRYSSDVPGETKTGAFGYMSGTNCEQPMFKFAGAGDTSTLVDVYYELKFWQAAAGPGGTEGKSPDQAIANSQSGRTSPDAQSTAATPTTVAQTEPQVQPFSFRGVHAGMTVAEVKAATARYRDEMQCVDNYGGPKHDTPAIECSFGTDSGGVKLFFFRKRLFYIRWRCADNDECAKEKALMNFHFGKPKSNRMETHPAQVGAFREQTVRWRSRQESASVGGGQFEVLDYDFAPSFVQRQ